MHSPPSPSQPPPASVQARVPEMSSTATIPHHPLPDDPSYSLIDWSDFLDFSLDEQLTIDFGSDSSLPIPPAPEPSPVSPDPDNSADRIRKRDPRLSCSNFLAGRVPCACPELDEMLEEEEGVPGKKRTRTVRIPSGTARCQVLGCEVDISELKGYHKRHRVCLRCANASAVFIDGQSKRYCQQCGKFHILSDFDEGKRSCRRKLERHNNRRRRKPSDSRGTVEKETQQVLLAKDVGCDDETGKDTICLSSQMVESETLLESDGHISTLGSANGSQNIQSDSGVSFMASGETQVDGEKNNSKNTHSTSYCDNKGDFSSLCPAGRISFKLYDWNPAEFPRRLRHQIFQWLGSMPVELEGYIRPGCTILTMFIAMPKLMWVKLFEEPDVYIHDLVAGPGNMLSGKGTFFVHLNNMIFRVMKDGTSVMKVKVKEQAPKLHYVHPTCFEAGKPMEFIVCGNNLLQPKFRFLVSFAGKYLAYNFCAPPLCCQAKGNTVNSFDHQLLKICVPHTEPDFFGPAFIEVENQSGLSNFIPILIGDQEICAEMKLMQHKFDASLCSKGSQFVAASSSCQVSVLRQTMFSEFILDIAWILKEPALENTKLILTSQRQRFNHLLNFLVQNESIAILGRVLYYIKIVMGKSLSTTTADADMMFLKRNMDYAGNILCQKLQKTGNLVLYSRGFVSKGDGFSQGFENVVLSIVPVTNQDIEVRKKGELDAKMSLASIDTTATLPLLNEEVVMSVNLIKEQPRKSCNRLFTNTVLTPRPLIFIISAAAVCFGVCAVLLHPQKAGEFVTTIRRCLLDNP